MSEKKTDPSMASHHQDVVDDYLWRCGIVALEAAIGQLAYISSNLEEVARLLEEEAAQLREFG